MKLKTNFFYTLRENAKDEDSTSGNLLVRSGMIKKIGAGIYMFMPLGLRTFNTRTINAKFNSRRILRSMWQSSISW